MAKLLMTRKSVFVHCGRIHLFLPLKGMTMRWIRANTLTEILYNNSEFFKQFYTKLTIFRGYWGEN